jgi:hypothetical protein
VVEGKIGKQSFSTFAYEKEKEGGIIIKKQTKKRT